MMDRETRIYVGVAQLELHVPEARSLKAKRSWTRPLVDRIRARHQVLVSEVSYQDLHQRAAFAVAALSTDVVDVEARLQRVEKTIFDSWAGHILCWEVEIMEMAAHPSHEVEYGNPQSI
jgi:uncharacterized protein YlxP (DUF503 family)